MDILSINMPRDVPPTLAQHDLMVEEFVESRLQDEMGPLGIGRTSGESPPGNSSPCDESYLELLLEELDVFAAYSTSFTNPDFDIAAEAGIRYEKLFEDIKRLIRNPELFPNEEMRQAFLTVTAGHVHGMKRVALRRLKYLNAITAAQNGRSQDRFEKQFNKNHPTLGPHQPWYHAAAIRRQPITEQSLKEAQESNSELTPCQYTLPQSLLHIFERWRSDNEQAIEEIVEESSRDSTSLETQRAVDHEIITHQTDMKEGRRMVSNLFFMPPNILVRSHWHDHSVIGPTRVTSLAALLSTLPEGHGVTRLPVLMPAWRFIRAEHRLTAEAYNNAQSETVWSVEAL